MKTDVVEQAIEEIKKFASKYINNGHVINVINAQLDVIYYSYEPLKQQESQIQSMREKIKEAKELLENFCDHWDFDLPKEALKILTALIKEKK
jgi:hypothetical protein